MTEEQPHGLGYSLTLHAPDGVRLIGFDNAHPLRRRRGRGRRDRHSLQRVHHYDYEDATTLLEDFWKEVDKVLDKVLREKGSIP